jgi:hypothetical protein
MSVSSESEQKDAHVGEKEAKTLFEQVIAE